MVATLSHGIPQEEEERGQKTAASPTMSSLHPLLPFDFGFDLDVAVVVVALPSWLRKCSIFKWHHTAKQGIWIRACNGFVMTCLALALPCALASTRKRPRKVLSGMRCSGCRVIPIKRNRYSEKGRHRTFRSVWEAPRRNDGWISASFLYYIGPSCDSKIHLPSKAVSENTIIATVLFYISVQSIGICILYWLLSNAFGLSVHMTCSHVHALSTELSVKLLPFVVP